MTQPSSRGPALGRLLLRGLFGLTVVAMTAVVALALLGEPDAAKYIGAIWAATCGVVGLVFKGTESAGRLESDPDQLDEPSPPAELPHVRRIWRRMLYP